MPTEFAYLGMALPQNMQCIFQTEIDFSRAHFEFFPYLSSTHANFAIHSHPISFILILSIAYCTTFGLVHQAHTLTCTWPRAKPAIDCERFIYYFPIFKRAISPSPFLFQAPFSLARCVLWTFSVFRGIFLGIFGGHSLKNISMLDIAHHSERNSISISRSS